MFSKFTIALAAVAAVSAAPLPRRSVARRGHPSLDLWGGHESLRGFDNFYGVDNYSGSHHEINVVPEHQVVCHAQQIEIVQQRLLVVQEWAKKIVTELVCEVEAQTFVFEQFHGSLGHFSKDLTRDSGFQVGYDHEIIQHFPKLWDDKYENWGFTGHDYGKNYVVPSGHNWDDNVSPKSVHDSWVVSQTLKYEHQAPVEVKHEPYYAPEHPTYYAPEHVPEYTPEHDTYAPEYTPEHDTYYAPPAHETPYYAPEPSYAPAPWPSEAPASFSEAPISDAPAPTESFTPQSDPALAPATTDAAAAVDPTASA